MATAKPQKTTRPPKRARKQPRTKSGGRSNTPNQAGQLEARTRSRKRPASSSMASARSGSSTTGAAKRTSSKTAAAKSATSSLGHIANGKLEGLKGQGLIEVRGARKLELRQQLGMTRSMFGRIVNVAERTIAKVESGEETPAKLKRPYNEVYRLWQALSELVDPSVLGNWFQSPNASFDGLKPIEVIERGEIDLLWNMVFELQTGMPG